MASKFPKSNVLVLGSNSVHCLLPSTLITRADALLDRHRIDEAVELADQQLKRLQGKVSVDNDEADELRYVYQRIGFQCLTETLFDDAGRHFFSGDLDPRVLISYYPALRGAMFKEEDFVNVFAGVAEHMPPEDSIDSIIAINLVRNYSPHLAPNTSTAPPTVELRHILNVAATDMLKVYLRKWRAKKRKEVPEDDKNARRVNEVVDTVLCKLYSEANETTDLFALISGPNDVLLSEIEPLLIASNRYDALCRMYKSRGDENKLLDVWSRLVTGELIDEDVHDPLDSIFTMLSEKRDRALTEYWGVWLLKWDAERAMKLLTSLGTKRHTKSQGAPSDSTDEVALLRRIQETNPDAGLQYLEYLVLQRRSQSKDLHDQLASTYVCALLDCLEDETTWKLWRAKLASYTTQGRSAPSDGRTIPHQNQSFLSYFVSTTPDSVSKHTRLRAIMFLQTSTLYDPEMVLALLDGGGGGRGSESEKGRVLALERAVLLGKLGRHHAALMTLVHTLRDRTSAEIYCGLGGQGVFAPKTIASLAERSSITLCTPPPKSKSKGDDKEHVDESVKKELTRVLLEVYVDEGAGDGMIESTARLLDAQGGSLDIMEVLPLLPPTYPLRPLTSFLARSLRHSLHLRHEGQLVKALASSQNLAVQESTWDRLRDAGGIVEEPTSDTEESDYEKEYNEKHGIVGEVEGGGAEGLGLQLDEKLQSVQRQRHERVRGYDVGMDDDDESLT